MNKFHPLFGQLIVAGIFATSLNAFGEVLDGNCLSALNAASASNSVNTSVVTKIDQLRSDIAAYDAIYLKIANETDPLEIQLNNVQGENQWQVVASDYAALELSADSKKTVGLACQLIAP